MPTGRIDFQQVVIPGLPVCHGSPLLPERNRIIRDIRHIDGEILAAQVAITALILFHCPSCPVEAPAGNTLKKRLFRASGNQPPP
jgi:hypothetical protein